MQHTVLLDSFYDLIYTDIVIEKESNLSSKNLDEVNYTEDLKLKSEALCSNQLINEFRYYNKNHKTYRQCNALKKFTSY